MNSSQLIALGSYRFDPGKGQLVDGAGQPVRLRNKSLRVLEVLVGAAGRIVGKEEIIAAAWEQTFVSDESLSQCISDIRRGLRDTKREILRTIPGRGFVLTASPVEPPSPGRLPIVAVEPIRTDEADPEAFRVAERIREEILRAITRRRGIRVTSGAPNGAETDYRISGAVRNTGNTVSAFMEIEEIDGRGIFHAEAFELSDESRDDFAERVARKITNVQRVSAIAHFGERLRDHPDDDLDLQQLLQKAAFHYSRITEEDTDAARSVLSSAVERFPSSPMALAMLAATEVHMYPLIALDRSEDRVSAALDLAERAVRAGPRSISV